MLQEVQLETLSPAMLAEAGQLIKRQKRLLAEEIVEELYRRQPQQWDQFDSTIYDKSVRDVHYHLAYLAEALRWAEPILFLEYVLWVRSVFAGLGFPQDLLPLTIETMWTTVTERLPRHLADVVHVYLILAAEQLSQSQERQPSFLPTQGPLAGLARMFHAALLRGEQQRAYRLVMEAVEQGARIQDLYLDVFQPSQQEVGRLWQQNQISTVQEHFCTTATGAIISQLYPHLLQQAHAKNGHAMRRRCVAASPTGETHELGLRMVADFLQMDGWDVYFVGGNVPGAELVQAILETQTELLVLSTTMVYYIDNAATLIRRMRAEAPHVKIMVGGYPFSLAPNLWKKIGGDATAPNALKAVEIARRLV